MNQSVSKNVAKKVYIIQVKRADVPVSCPPAGADVALSHPRVYLDLNKNGEALCPYCSNHFVLAKPPTAAA